MAPVPLCSLLAKLKVSLNSQVAAMKTQRAPAHQNSAVNVALILPEFVSSTTPFSPGNPLAAASSAALRTTRAASF